MQIGIGQDEETGKYRAEITLEGYDTFAEANDALKGLMRLVGTEAHKQAILRYKLSGLLEEIDRKDVIR